MDSKVQELFQALSARINHTGSAIHSCDEQSIKCDLTSLYEEGIENIPIAELLEYLTTTLNWNVIFAKKVTIWVALKNFNQEMPSSDVLQVVLDAIDELNV